MNKYKKILLFFGLIIIDRLCKFLVIKLNLNFVFNTGIAFGLLNDSILAWILSIFGFLLVFFIFFKQKKNFIFLFIIAGGTSNFLDRLAYGGIIDYIHLPYLPSFNLADLFINTGVVLYILSLLDMKIFGLGANANLNSKKTQDKL